MFSKKERVALIVAGALLFTISRGPTSIATDVRVDSHQGNFNPAAVLDISQVQWGPDCKEACE